MKSNIIVLTAGGTGGHIFPAEAVATCLAKRKYQLVFISDKRGNAISGTLGKVPIHFVSAEGIAGKGFVKKAIASCKLLWGTLQSMILLIKLKPALLIGFGGYASVPATLAAEILHIPVILHEQNALLGKANRLLAKKAQLIATSFDPTGMIPSGIVTKKIGMPVRSSILKKVGTPYIPHKKEFHLLIMGGSQGAKVFAKVIPEALNLLPKELKSQIVLHQQVRAENMEKVKELYKDSLFKSIELSPFFENIQELLSMAHLIISRSGSSSLAEFAALGRPSLLIPLPTSADNHQVENARVFTQKGAGWLIIEKDFTAEKLATRLTELMQNSYTLEHAAKCALLEGKKNAAKTFADTVEILIKKGAK